MFLLMNLSFVYFLLSGGSPCFLNYERKFQNVDLHFCSLVCTGLVSLCYDSCPFDWFLSGNLLLWGTCLICCGGYMFDLLWGYMFYCGGGACLFLKVSFFFFYS